MAEQPTPDRMEVEIAAYVLDALHPAEARAVGAHLESCASCRQLEARLRRTAQAVPLSVEEATPPARLRERILVAAGDGGAAPPVARRIPLRPASPRPSAWRRLVDAAGAPVPGMRAAFAVVLIALVALAGWNLYLSRQLHATAPSHTPATVTTHAIVPSTQSSLGGAEGEITLAGNVNVVSFSGLPQLPAGEVYQLWVGPSATQVAGAGVFRPAADGTRTLVLRRDLSQDKLIALTVEPGPSGTKAPTQAPQMVGVF